MLKLNILPLADALDKKQITKSVTIDEINKLKSAVSSFLNNLNPQETEENQKNLFY